MTTKVITGLATSLDGFIAGADDSPAQPLGEGGERLFDWIRDGERPEPLLRVDEDVRAFGGVLRPPRRPRGRGDHGAGYLRHLRGIVRIGRLPGVPLFAMTH